MRSKGDKTYEGSQNDPVVGASASNNVAADSESRANEEPCKR